jgi:translation initiation factor IF-3
VRLVDENGVQAGIVATREALQMALAKGLDLIEVAPNANPPVCRIMDFGKFKYAQAKRDRESRKKQKTVEMRAIRIRPRIDDHDFQVKLKLLRRLLGEGDKVKINLLFRSREMTHPEFGQRVLAKLAEGASDVGQVERAPGLEGRMLTMIIAPKTEKAE